MSKLTLALANYAYIMRHVAGGQVNHAAAITARNEVAALAGDQDVDALIAAYERDQRAADAIAAHQAAFEELRIERQRLAIWEQHLHDLERGIDLRLPDGTPLTLEAATREHATTVNRIEWLSQQVNP